jgi:hypothetical protein
LRACRRTVLAAAGPDRPGRPGGGFETSRRSRGAWHDFVVEARSDRRARGLEFVVELQAEPELGRHAEEAAESERSVGGDRPIAMQNFSDAVARHADRLGQRVSADPKLAEPRAACVPRSVHNRADEAQTQSAGGHCEQRPHRADSASRPSPQRVAEPMKGAPHSRCHTSEHRPKPERKSQPRSGGALFWAFSSAFNGGSEPGSRQDRPLRRRSEQDPAKGRQPRSRPIGAPVGVLCVRPGPRRRFAEPGRVSRCRLGD